MKKGLIWLKNDLRLRDSPALDRACRECGEVLFVYCFDDRILNSSGNLRMGSIRTKFLLESLGSLRDQIQTLGGQIEILSGEPGIEIPKLFKCYGADHCYAQREDASEEKSDQRTVAEQVDLILTEGKGLFENEDLPFELGELPAVFSSFRRKVEKNLEVRPTIPSPSSFNCSWEPVGKLPDYSFFGHEPPKSDPRAVLRFRGGEKEAWNWITEWIWEKDCLRIYKETRNGLVGSDYSSKLSPWLANGSLSAVQVYWEIKKYEDQRIANDSTYWLFFELLWREFFRFVARRHGSKIFQRSGLKQESTTNRRGDSRTFEKWKLGRTENDFVNANMNELAKTGWMSNRGRQNVASYLIHDLGQDWLDGARHFENQLIDYDPCSNYGNWMYLGGVGNDPRPNRAFNLDKQAEYYDPDHRFRKLWLG